MTDGKSGDLQERRKAIGEILRRSVIRSQADLVARLAERGFSVTQSSVSRDLQRLGATRINGRYHTFDALMSGGAHACKLEEVAGYIDRVARAGPHLLVVQTPPGIASHVALSLDRENWPEVTGTVAGDDTFFIALPGRRQQARVEARLKRLMRRDLAD